MNVELKISFAWWWTWLYLPGLFFMVAMTGRQPKWDRVKLVLTRAVRIRYIEKTQGSLQA